MRDLILVPKRKALSEMQLEVQAAILARQYAASRFNEVTEPELIEAAIHDYQAADKRLNYLLRQAKNCR